MKKLLIVFITFVLTIKGMSQTKETIVTGSTLDTKNVPVESATIFFIRQKDSSIIKIAVSDKSGRFVFTDMPFGSYFTTISAISFTDRKSVV